MRAAIGGKATGSPATDRPAAGSATDRSDKSAACWVSRHSRLLIALAVVAVLAAVLYPPVQSCYVAMRTNGVLSSRLDDINATNEATQQEVDALMTREGIEDEARRNGYVYEGETAVDMAGVEDVSAEDETADETSAETPWYLSALDALFQFNPSMQGLS